MQSDILVKNENYGVTYERFSLAMFIKRLVHIYGIKTVLETSENGIKGIEGLNSLEFARQKCQVYLINTNTESQKFWSEFGLDSYLKFVETQDLGNLPFADNSFELVWDLKGLVKSQDPLKKLKEMTRVSKDLVLIFSINAKAFNFALHQLAHRLNHIVWDHGDINYMTPVGLSVLFNQSGLKDVRWGIIDAPPWPGSLGFRDTSYHLDQKKTIKWSSVYFEYLKKEKFPFWLWGSYLFEKLPLPKRLKLIYAHIFFVIGRKLIK